MDEWYVGVWMIKRYDKINKWMIWLVSTPEQSGPEYIMVVTLDGSSDIGAHISNLCYFISLRQLIRSKAGTNRDLFPRNDLFFFMRAQHVLSYHLI